MLPRTMFGRSLLIVVVPLILVQAIATWIFYDRHWEAISWRLSTGVAGDIALMIEAIQNAGPDAGTTRLLQRGGLRDRSRIHLAPRRAPAAASAAERHAGRGAADPGDARAGSTCRSASIGSTIRTGCGSRCSWPKGC